MSRVLLVAAAVGAATVLVADWMARTDVGPDPGLSLLAMAIVATVLAYSHVRKCWECNNVALHRDNVRPHVLCKKCGSQDTRLVPCKSQKR